MEWMWMAIRVEIYPKRNWKQNGEISIVYVLASSFG